MIEWKSEFNSRKSANCGINGRRKEVWHGRSIASARYVIRRIFHVTIRTNVSTANQYREKKRKTEREREKKETICDNGGNIKEQRILRRDFWTDSSGKYMDPATRQKKNSRRAVSNPMASNGGLEGIDNARRVSGGRGGAEGRKLCARNRRKSLQMYRFRWRRFIRRDVSLQRRDRRGRARARARAFRDGCKCSHVPAGDCQREPPLPRRCSCRRCRAAGRQVDFQPRL